MRNTDHIAMRGFTALEIVFVLVVLGILSAVAVPRFFDSRNQMEIRECGFRMEMMRDKMDSLLRMEHEKTGHWLSTEDLTEKLKAAFDPSGEHFNKDTNPSGEHNPHYELSNYKLSNDYSKIKLQCNRHNQKPLFSMAMPKNKVAEPPYVPPFWIATLDNAQFDPEKVLDFRLISEEGAESALSAEPQQVIEGKDYSALIWYGKDNNGNIISLGTSDSIKKIIASYSDYENGTKTTKEEYEAAQDNIKKLLGGYLPPSWRLSTNKDNINLYWSDFNWNDIDNNYYDMKNEIKTDRILGETAEDYTEVNGLKSKEYVNINTDKNKWITTMPIIWMRQVLSNSELTKMQYYVCLASFINPAQKPRPTDMDNELPPNGRRILVDDSKNTGTGILSDIYPYTQTDVTTDIKVVYVKNIFTEENGISLTTNRQWSQLMFVSDNGQDAAKKAYAAYLALKEKWLEWRYMNYNGDYKRNFLDEYVDKPN